MPSAGTISIISNINYLLSGIFYHYFHKKKFSEYPPPTSKVWKFFKRCNDSKTVKCQLCEVELTYTEATTNMLNHISVCLISF
jgi:hypothetical protein